MDDDNSPENNAPANSVANDITLPYELEFETKTNTLFGVVKEIDSQLAEASDIPGITPPPPNITGFSIRQHIEQLNYQDFVFPQTSINDFVKAIKDKKPGRYKLAERKDGHVEVLITADKSTATVKLSKSSGGKVVGKTDILSEVEKSKISGERLNRKELERLYEHNNEDMEVVIASSLPAVPGIDASLERLIASQTEKSRDSESEDSIDLREVFEFTVVDEGTPLLKKIPATAGTPGQDVLGVEITPAPGKDIPFTTPFEGVELSSDNENILVATIKGHPVFSKSGVKVDPILTLKSVNIHSGNIDYDGSVAIKGDIESGYIVNATGDIHVKGQVERATLKAGGDIIVQCGITGEEDSDAESEEEKPFLRCAGNLSAKFINHGTIESDGDVMIEEYLMQCHIVAKGSLLVGKEKGRGSIIGGNCFSETGIWAKSIGSEAFIVTNVSVGREEESSLLLKKLRQDQTRRTGELQKLTLMLNKIKATEKESEPGTPEQNKVKKIYDTIATLENYLGRLENKISEVESQIKPKEALKVSVAGNTYPNTIIMIDGARMHCEDIMTRQTFSIQGNMIVASALED